MLIILSLLFIIVLYFNTLLYTCIIDMFYLLFYIIGFFKQSKFFIPITTCFFSFIIFVSIVLIRIATPRFKLESLTKQGWSYGLLVLLICLLIFLIGYFVI